MTAIAAVVPVWNARARLEACLAALLAGTRVPEEIVVVDDGSSDGAGEAAARFPGVQVLRSDVNRGFAPSVNCGLGACAAPLVLLLNSDAELERGALEALGTALAARPTHAGVVPRLTDAGGATLASDMGFPRLRTALWHGTTLERLWPDSAELRRYFARGEPGDAERDVLQPPAACMLVRRSALDAVGGLDESMALYFNDVDLCLRLARAGLRLAREPAARCVHHVGASALAHPRRQALWHAGRLSYYRKHLGWRGTLAAKAGSALAFADHALRQLARRARGHPAEPVGQHFAELLTLLAA